MREAVWMYLQSLEREVCADKNILLRCWYRCRRFDDFLSLMFVYKNVFSGQKINQR
jgi:hypothetical protein